MAEMWIWCFPSPDGMTALEFGLDYPDNANARTLHKNEDLIAGDIENLPDLWAVILNECQDDWFWLARQYFWVNSAEKTTIELVPGENNPYGTMRLLTCDPIMETELFAYTMLYINMNPRSRKCGTTLPVPTSVPSSKITTIKLTASVDESSWGAIKELYK